MPDQTPVEVPDWLRPAVAVAVEQLPNAVIREIGQQIPGGFTRRETILEAWKRHARGFHRLEPGLCDHLRLALPACRVLRLIEPAWTSSFLRPLGRLVGPEILAVALWLDHRPAVAALATPEVLTPAHPDTTVGDARGQWLELVRGFLLSPLGADFTPAASAAPASGSSHAPNTGTSSDGDSDGQELELARKRLAQARKQLSETTTAHQKELAHLRAAHETEVATLASRSSELEARLREMESEFARRVRDEVAQALDARVRPWFSRVVALEEADETAAGAMEKLAADLRAALDQQRRADRHQANHARLRERLGELLELRDQVQWARAESLQPLPNWPALLSRLDTAIAELRRELREVPDAAPWAADLAADLAACAAPADVDAVMSRATHLADAGLLGENAVEWLRRRADERRSVLNDALVSRTPPAPVRLREVIAGQTAGVVLVDAYNWIGRAGTILGVPTDPATFPAALRQLQPLLRRTARQAARAELLLFVDGPRDHTETWADNLRLVYSGGTGADRADAVIRGHLEHLRNCADPRAAFVISDDRTVRTCSLRFGAVVESCEAFARRLRSVG